MEASATEEGQPGAAFENGACTVGSHPNRNTGDIQERGSGVKDGRRGGDLVCTSEARKLGRGPRRTPEGILDAAGIHPCICDRGVEGAIAVATATERSGAWRHPVGTDAEAPKWISEEEEK